MAKWSRISVLLLVFVLAWSACEARHVVKLGDGEDATSSYGCDACLQFTSEAEMILSDPKTQERAIALVEEMACHSLTASLKKKCVELVNVYVPDALTALQAYLGPQICTETGLCVAESTWMSHLTLRNPRRPVMANTKACTLCEDFAQDALKYLSSNMTKSKIIETLHLGCARLDEIRDQCDFLVDIYGPVVLERLDTLSPNEVCQLTHVCEPTANPKPDVRVCKVAGVTRNDCAICQFVVLELKIKLRDPSVQEKLLNFLLNGCDRVQNHVDQCKFIVAQYGPFILSNLDTMLDADALCTKLKVCPNQLQMADEPVLRFPLNGENRYHHLHDHQHRHGYKHRLIHKS